MQQATVGRGWWVGAVQVQVHHQLRPPRLIFSSAPPSCTGALGTGRWMGGWGIRTGGCSHHIMPPGHASTCAAGFLGLRVRCLVSGVWCSVLGAWFLGNVSRRLAQRRSCDQPSHLHLPTSVPGPHAPLALAYIHSYARLLLLFVSSPHEPTRHSPAVMSAEISPAPFTHPWSPVHVSTLVQVL